MKELSAHCAQCISVKLEGIQQQVKNNLLLGKITTVHNIMKRFSKCEEISARKSVLNSQGLQVFRQHCIKNR